jgi:NHLM bacteriocin system ABC transporter ATP-binding protein
MPVSAPNPSDAPLEPAGELLPRRVPIDAPASLWWVTHGAIDVFLQRADAQGGQTGARHHLYRIEAGAVLPALPAHDLPSGTFALATALPGTRAVRMQVGELAAALGNAGSREQARRAVDGFAVAITGAIDPGTLPRSCTDPAHAAEATLELVHEQCLSPGSGVSWLAVESGNLLWLGRYEYALNEQSSPWPVTRKHWLRAEGGARVRRLEPDALADPVLLAAALSLCVRYTARERLAELELATAAERSRLDQRADRSRILTQEAMARLVALGRGERVEAAGGPRTDLLLGALEPIGRELGIGFRAPTSADRRAFERDPVGTLALVSGVRVRRVALREQWWQHDGGPMLVQLREPAPGSQPEDGAAAQRGWASVRRVGGRYLMFDPASGHTARVNAEVAGRIEAFAWSFYRPFPARAMGLADLLRFGSRGLSRDVVRSLLLGVLIGLLGLAVPIATGVLIDRVIPAADRPGLVSILGALVAMALAGGAFEFARALAIVRIEGRMDASIQSALWDRVLKLPAPFFRHYTAGDLAQRINGVSEIRQALSGGAIGTLLSGVFSLMSLGLLLYYSVALTLVALALTGAAVAVTVALGALRIREERAAGALSGELSGVVFQYLRGVPRLRISAAESRAFANWAKLFTDLRQRMLTARRYGNWLRTFFAGFGPLSTAALFAVLGALMLDRAPGAATISTGQFIAFSAAFGSLMGAMTELAQTGIDLLRLVPLYERAKPVLAALPEVDERKVQPGELRGAIEVSGVAFSYGEGAPVLDDVSFSVPAGGYIALVGASGSGKSTLLRLMLGFERPSAGAIYIDDQNLADLDITAVRRQFGVVLQNGQLIAGDIYSNIVGATQLTLDDAMEAAQMAGLAEDIAALPMGMHTVVSEGTATLSAGQRQRILIARALVHRPRVVFFDEATSALDNRTQSIVTRSLAQMKATRIVVAHRLSTIAHADRILVLAGGRIVQDGSYAELMAAPGPFADLAARQIA